MFWNIYQTIVNKISEYNPIRNFIKYALDKTLNQFLSRQLTLQDFKNGPLNLSNLQLNVSKINKTKLVGSPYILHYGTIGQLNIVLPPFSEISTKSIEINVSNIQLSLKPNKQFAENFKNTMKEIFQMKAFQVEQEQLQGEMSQNSTADFFKQLMKNIIMNIKLKVNGIIVKLYMNTPSENNRGSQYYLMLRIPNIIANRQDDLPLKKSSDQEQYKFKLQMPQISLHLLRQDTGYPQYENYQQQYKKQDFPFIYPPVSHPSTIFLVGAENLGSQSQKKNTFFSLILVTDYGKKKRDLNMKLEIPNIEAMVNPLQAKILSRFLVQVLQFKKIFSQVMQQLGMKSSGAEIDKSQMNLRRTFSRSTSQDIFSSMIMSVNDFQGFQQGNSKKRKARESSLLDSIIQCQQMKKDADQFNQDFKKQLAKKGKNQKEIEEFTAIDFKMNIITKVQLTHVTVYILKYVPQIQFLRFWLSGFKKPSKINDKIGCSHFMLTLNKSQLEIQEGGKIVKFSMRKVKGYNVKLVDKSVHQQHEQEFFDIRSSSEFYGEKQDVNTFKMELKQFNLQEGHFCVQQILRVSQKPSDNIDQKKFKLHNFLPKSDKQVSSLQHVFVQPGIQVKIDKKTSHLIKINIIDINVSMTLEVLKDFLNIAYPIFSYRGLSNAIGIRKQSIQGQDHPRMPKRRNLFESQYDFYRDSYMEDQQENSKKQKTIILLINQIKLAYRQSTNQEQFTQMIKHCKEKTFDCQNFNHTCFCNIQKRGIYAEFYSIQFHQKAQFKLSCKAVEAGLMLIKQSRINDIQSIVKVELQNQDDALKLFMQQNKDRQKIFSLYVPTLRVKLDENLIRDLISLSVNKVNNVMALQNFKNFLEFQIKTIQGQFAEIQKKVKKHENSGEKIIQVLVGKIKIDVPFLNAEICKFFFTNLNEENTIKIQSFILALKTTKFYRLGSLTNRELKVNQYQDKPITENIRPCQVIMQFGYPRQKQLKTTFESKVKKQFFKALHQEKSNFVVKIERKDTSKISKNVNEKKTNKKTNQKDISFNDKFKFKKCQSIQEQRQSKQIKLNVNVPININAANLIEATRLKNEIEKYKSLFKDSQSTIKLVESRSIMMQRRQSEQDNQQLQLSLSFNRLNLDIRPYYLSDEKQIIFSNTRSIVSLYNTFKVQVIMNKDIGEKYISCQFPSIRYYFLSHQDRQTDLNPILIEDKNYLKYGFKYLAEVDNLSLQLRITDDKMSASNLVEIKGKLKEIKLCFSVETLQFFKIHIQHFVKHNLERDYSWNDDDSEQFISLKIQDVQKEFQQLQYFQQEAEDLTNALEIYEEKMIKKNQDQSQFKNRAFSKKEMPKTTLDVNSFLIGLISIQINTGSDYLFSNPPKTMDQSSQKKRILCDLEEAKQYLQIKIKNLQLALQLTNEEPQPGLYTLISVELCDINYNTQKPTEGFIKRLVGGGRQTQPYSFSIFRNESQMKVILNKTHDRIEVKLTSAILSLGFCSDLLNIVNLMKKYEKESIKTGRKKYYYKKQLQQKQKKPKNLQKRVLFLFPSTKIILTLEYKNVQLINCQSIKANELFLNEQLRNKDLIESKITKWVKDLVLSNVGGLISGSMIKLLGTLIDQLVQFVKFIVDGLLGR